MLDNGMRCIVLSAPLNLDGQDSEKRAENLPALQCTPSCRIASGGKSRKRKVDMGIAVAPANNVRGCASGQENDNWP